MGERFWRLVSHTGTAWAGTPWVGLMPPDPGWCNGQPSTLSAASGALVKPARPWARRRRQGTEPEIARECEAFLWGCYYELLNSDDQRVPGWVWINPLAHAERAEIQRLADLRPGGHDPRACLSYLAGEVLRSADRDGMTLERLQRDTLVPLEFALLGQPAPVSDFATLAKFIRAKLDQQPPG